MTQFSMFWTTTPPAQAVGDGSAPYTRTNWNDFLRRTFLYDTTTEGVLVGYLNQLEVTGGASPLSVNTGGAHVYGVPYLNDAAVSLAVTTPVVGNTGGHVILRTDWAAQTVRLVAVRNTDGVVAIPTLTQVAGTTWEIRLATFVISTLGVITLTDARNYAQFATPIVTRRQGSSAVNWDQTGTTNYMPGASMIQVGAAVITILVGNQTATTSITYGKSFGAAPMTMLSFHFTPATATADGYALSLTVEGPTGFTARATKTAAVAGVDENVTFYWVSIGPR